jgi:hypothetical protein
VEAAWAAAGYEPEGLTQLACGDVLDTDTGAVAEAPDALHRRHTAEERTAYALTLSDKPLPHDQIAVPGVFQVQWKRLLSAAAANMDRAAQAQKLNIAYDIEIEVRKNTVASTPEGGLVHRFALDAGEPQAERRFIRFGVDDGLWLMVLLGAANWNNVEVGSLITCERTPDTQDPQIHILMNWFRL